MTAFSRPTDARSPLRQDRHNRLGFAYQFAFVRGLGRWKNVILYSEIKIDPAKLKMRSLTRSSSFLYQVRIRTPRLY